MTEIHLIGIMIGCLIAGFVFNYSEVIKIIKELWNEE